MFSCLANGLLSFAAPFCVDNRRFSYSLLIMPTDAKIHTTGGITVEDLKRVAQQMGEEATDEQLKVWMCVCVCVRVFLPLLALHMVPRPAWRGCSERVWGTENGMHGVVCVCFGGGGGGGGEGGAGFVVCWRGPRGLLCFHLEAME